MNRRGIILSMIAIAVMVSGCLSSVGFDDPSSEASSPPEKTGASDTPRSASAVDAGDRTNGTDATNRTGSDPLPKNITFGSPVSLTPVERDSGFEPSIESGPNGTLFVTANAGFRIDQNRRLASWLWYSSDGGTSWKPLPSPAQAHEAMYGDEGEIAVDDAGHLYFVDLLVADNTISRWTVRDSNPEWDYSRPVQGTAAPLDDRPWLASHGDGFVYYLANTAANVATPGPRNETGVPGDRIWFHQSTDGGQTWTLGRSFANSESCGLGADPATERTVAVICTEVPAPGLKESSVDTSQVSLYRSEDRGESWRRTVITELDHGTGPGFPSVAFGNSTILASWVDEDLEDNQTGQIKALTVDRSGRRNLQAPTPFAGSFGMAWSDVGPGGTGVIAFYGSHDKSPGPDTDWWTYALVTSDVNASDPEWHLAKISDRPAATSADPPADFLQTTVNSRGRVFVAHQMSEEADPVPLLQITGYGDDVLVSRQVSGPNLR